MALYLLGIYASYYSPLGGTVYILVHVVVVEVAGTACQSRQLILVDDNIRDLLSAIHSKIVFNTCDLLY